jgi:serine/threonine protein kinase
MTSTEIKGRGNLRWVAPEVFDGGERTPASDVWSVAMVMYEVGSAISRLVCMAHIESAGIERKAALRRSE